MRRQTSLIHLSIRAVALGMFCFYLAWNAFWLASGEVPDSILKAFTGIPCPTTGGTRSLVALMRGEWQQSLLWNPLTLAYVALMAGSLGLLGHQLLKGKRLALPPAFALLWAGFLAAGWILKLVVGPEYW